MAAVSPLAPERFPELAPIAGVRLAAFAAGIRYPGRNDLMLAELAPDSAVAGVFTRSLTAGPPVLWCR
jgi:glutamate N-acetyltransferase/amino-acid N-acetyltransferase